MNVITRKAKSAISILSSESKPFQVIRKQISRNFKQLIIRTKKEQMFAYKTNMGFTFVCLPTVATSQAFYLNSGDYEDIELRLAARWLQRGDCCLDLGANVGYFSSLFASRVGNTGKVIAIEASPQTFEHLKLGITKLGLDEQVILEQVCLTDKEGYVDFMVGFKDGLDVSQSLQVAPEMEANYEKVSIPSISINTLLEKHKDYQNISLVKMDIEAAEPLALRGGKRLFELASLPLFIVEVYKLGLERLGFYPSDIYSFFPTDLFELYQVNRSYPNPFVEFQYGGIYPLDNPDKHNWGWHTNLIAIPKVGKYAHRRQLIQEYLPN
jgi:FkbM family methyltransferase